MDFKIVWTEAALSDLGEICSYVAQADAEAALRLGNGILAHVKILGSFPFIGPTYPRGAHGPLREIVFGSCRIFYDVDEGARCVEVLHVWHGARQDPEF